MVITIFRKRRQCRRALLEKGAHRVCRLKQARVSSLTYSIAGAVKQHMWDILQHVVSLLRTGCASLPPLPLSGISLPPCPSLHPQPVCPSAQLCQCASPTAPADHLQVFRSCEDLGVIGLLLQAAPHLGKVALLLGAVVAASIA